MVETGESEDVGTRVRPNCDDTGLAEPRYGVVVHTRMTNHLAGGPPAKLTAGAHRCAGGRCARGWRRRSAPARGRYPANRHRVCIRTRSCVRRLTILIAIGAAFGYDTRAHVLSVEHSRGARPHSGPPHSAPFALNRGKHQLVSLRARVGVWEARRWCLQCNTSWRALHPQKKPLVYSHTYFPRFWEACLR